MTPPARWRPANGVLVLGPATCQECGATVWFGRARTRVNGEEVMGEVRCWREWGRTAAHAHAPVKGLRRTLTPKAKHPQLANSRAEFASRARAWDNDADEYSVAIAHNAQRPVSRLYSEARGVDVPEYRRNG